MPATLTASGVSSGGATLTIANHTGDWYYMADAAPHDSCQGPVSGATESLSGLSASTAYVYTAYSDSGCSDSVATAASFTTSDVLAFSNVTADTAILTFSGSTPWYIKQTNPSGNDGCGMVSTSGIGLGALTPNTDYTFEAHANSSCTDKRAQASFLTEPLPPTDPNPGGGGGGGGRR